MTRAKKSKGGPATEAGPLREVQFLIERECPEAGDVPTNLEEYPAAVFVYWPPTGKPVLRCSSPRFYIMLDSEAVRLGYNSADRWYVCEHMGRIIE